MNLSETTFKYEEKALYALRQLYSSYGYSRFKVSKFEEYDFYARNKSFLVSENILTFTDTNGKLMALKPDVTLSIVKNTAGDDNALHKVYYNETVYRTSAGSDGFREIMQTGLECIGAVDLYSVCEVLMLAQKSLSLISEDSILDLSHMGFITGLLESAGVPEGESARMLEYIGNKNLSAIRAFCAEYQLQPQAADRICKITSLYAPLDRALEQIKPLLCGEKMQNAYEELCKVLDMMRLYGAAEHLYLDFSMVNDMRYYNGIVFRGYVKGIPNGVLSGGRYDRLLKKMGKNTGAIGFAVYLDLLARMESDAEQYDADVLLLYTEKTDMEALIQRVEALRAQGKSVRVQKDCDHAIRCRTRVNMDAEETEDKSV